MEILIIAVVAGLLFYAGSKGSGQSGAVEETGNVGTSDPSGVSLPPKTVGGGIGSVFPQVNDGSEFKVGDQLVFYGAPGGPGNSGPVLITTKGSDYYRYSIGGISQGSIPFAFIVSYRQAGGTVVRHS